MSPVSIWQVCLTLAYVKEYSISRTIILRIPFSNWEMGKDPIDLRNINPQWTERMKSNIPDKIIYGDDWDFITELKQKKESIYQKAKTILANKQKCTGQWKQNWKYNHQKKGIRNRRVMKECHQVRIKNWWPGRYKKEERTIRHCIIKQQRNMEKEMESKAKGKPTLAWIISRKHTSLLLMILCLAFQSSAEKLREH